jgi:hypothetical protein
MELWKLYNSISAIKSQIETTGKSRSLSTSVASLTVKKKWLSKSYNDLFTPRLENIEKSVQEMLSIRQYENMVMSYNLLKVLIDRDYDQSDSMGQLHKTHDFKPNQGWYD